LWLKPYPHFGGAPTHAFLPTVTSKQSQFDRDVAMQAAMRAWANRSSAILRTPSDPMNTYL
jgi:hypothetical protein